MDPETDGQTDLEILTPENDEAPEDKSEKAEKVEKVGKVEPVGKKKTPDDEPEDFESDEEPKKDEDEDEDVEDVPTLSAYTRPTVKEIQKEFPDFFKKFPDLRTSLFREQEYSAIFPTVDDAKEAITKIESFDNLEEMVLSGSRDGFKNFLSAAEEGKKGALQEIAANFLPALHSISPDLYFKVTNPILENVLQHTFEAGKKQGDENLQNSAQHIANFLFGDPDYATGAKRTAPLETPKKDESFEQEKAKFYIQRYEDLLGRVTTSGKSAINREIIKDLDPNGVFNDFTTKQLSKAIFDEVDEALGNDAQHVANMNALWKRAQKAGYSGDWEDRIRTAYLSRARALMPAIRNRLRSEAMKTKERKMVEETSRREPSSRGPSGASTTTNLRNLSAKDIDWNKTSDLDLISGKATLRK